MFSVQHLKNTLFRNIKYYHILSDRLFNVLFIINLNLNLLIILMYGGVNMAS